jgi:DNA-binding Xre family transcriptional regulator
MTRVNLHRKKGISPATVAKMSKGSSIDANVLERICAAMQCNVGDMMIYMLDPASTPKGNEVV